MMLLDTIYGDGIRLACSGGISLNLHSSPCFYMQRQINKKAYMRFVDEVFGTDVEPRFDELSYRFNFKEFGLSVCTKPNVSLFDIYRKSPTNCTRPQFHAIHSTHLGLVFV